MRPEYVIDPRHGLHDAIEELVVVADVALLAVIGPDPPGMQRFDNSGR